jgi:cytoskeletal protein CcmA (bactofilin family)
LFTMLFFSGAFWKGWDAMRSLMEFLAVATLGLVVIWLLRRRWRSFPTIAVVMGAIICSLAMPPAANAAETKHGDPNYTLRAGEVVKTDLFVAADRTQINGDVDGDLIVFSHSVTVNGHITGDILGFAAELTVNGPVDGNVRAFSQTIVISSNIGKNVMVFGSEMNLRDTANVGGTITLFTGDTALSGHVAGDLLAFGGSFDINGVLGHDATVQADTLSIGSSAEIKGRTIRKSGGIHAQEAESRNELFVRKILLAPNAAVGSKFRVRAGGALARPGIFLRCGTRLQESRAINRSRLTVPVCDSNCSDYYLHYDCGNRCRNLSNVPVGHRDLLSAGLCGFVAG